LRPSRHDDQVRERSGDVSTHAECIAASGRHAAARLAAGNLGGGIAGDLVDRGRHAGTVARQRGACGPVDPDAGAASEPHGAGDGIHAALLSFDGIISSPKTAQTSRGRAAEALLLQTDVIQAVTFLAAQSRRGMTRELVITPAGDRWLP